LFTAADVPRKRATTIPNQPANPNREAMGIVMIVPLLLERDVHPFTYWLSTLQRSAADNIDRPQIDSTTATIVASATFIVAPATFV
jgi:hypothetical protein